MSWLHAFAGYGAPTKSPKAVAPFGGIEKAAGGTSASRGTGNVLERRSKSGHNLFRVSSIQRSTRRQLRPKHVQSTEHLTVHCRSRRPTNVVLMVKLAGKEYCPYTPSGGLMIV
jgi:hypothetical protein